MNARPNPLFAFVLGASLLLAPPSHNGDDNATRIFVSATAAPGGDGSAAAPFQTIQDALTTARASSKKSIIQVLPGRYPIRPPSAGSDLDNRMILDIAGLTLLGSNQMVLDKDGFPAGAEPGTETLLVADPPLTGNQSIMKVAADDVTIANLSLDGATNLAGDSDVFTLARNSMIRDNIMTGVSIGLDFNGSGTIKGNLFTKVGAGCAVAPNGGVRGLPRVQISGNRFVGNNLGGVVLSGDNFYPGSAELLVAEVEGNDLTEHTRPNFGFGVRVFAVNSGPDAAPQGRVIAQFSNNRIHGNFFSVVIDAGFPSRTATHEWSADFDLQFEANEVFGNLHAPIVSFTRFTTTINPAQLNRFKYLQDSNYNITYSDLSLDGAQIDNPTTDPISGETLNNHLVIRKIAQHN